MLIPENRHHRAFDTMIKQSLSRTVLVFVALDCDSICCCNIIAHLLRVNHVKFSILPVVGYQSLKEKFDRLVSLDPNINSVLLINNGGAVDLTDFLYGEENAGEKTLYVFDCHRPFDLTNASRDNPNVLLFCDDTTSYNDLPIEEELSEDDEKMDENEREEKFKRQRRAERKIEDYYRGTYYTSSMSFYLYKIARRMSNNSNDLLWCTIVGITDQLEHERIRPDQYFHTLHELQREVLQFNIPSDFNDQNTFSKNPGKNGQIVFSQELRIVLYRHWNIFESLYHSKYIASQFMVWKESGRKKLSDFIVKLALSINESKRPFSAMNSQDQQGLSKRVKLLAKRYGLDDVFFGSFIRQQGPKSVISASEVVHAVTALLSMESPKVETFFNNFWKAYDCLNIKNTALSTEGIDFSKKLCKAIIRQGNLVLEKKAFTSKGPFRYVVIDEVVDSALLINPVNLLSTALFLNSLFDVSSRHKNRPFVLFVLNKVDGLYSVLGIPKKDEEEFDINPFGTAFRVAAEKTGSRYRQEGFESNFMEIRKEDCHKFLECLHSGYLEI